MCRSNSFRNTAPYVVLGTDGYGRRTREDLRDFFEVDSKMIVYTALKTLADNDQFNIEDLPEIIKKLGIDPNSSMPTYCLVLRR